MRHLASITSLAIVLSLVPMSASARCAPRTLDNEASESEIVAEATLLAVTAQGFRFRAVASWKGTPPREFTVARNGGRGPVFGTESDIGTTYLLFMNRHPNGGFGVSRCGSSGRHNQSADAIAELRARGLRRTVVR